MTTFVVFKMSRMTGKGVVLTSEYSGRVMEWPCMATAEARAVIESQGRERTAHQAVAVGSLDNVRELARQWGESYKMAVLTGDWSQHACDWCGH